MKFRKFLARKTVRHFDVDLVAVSGPDFQHFEVHLVNHEDQGFTCLPYPSEAKARTVFESCNS